MQPPIMGSFLMTEYPQSRTVWHCGQNFFESIYANMSVAVTGLGAAYNMAPDLALVLAVAAVGLVGDPVAQSWSIGGRYTPVLPLTTAAGILGGHNKLEGDASFGRVCLVGTYYDLR
jgi:hypothetical protein